MNTLKSLKRFDPMGWRAPSFCFCLCLCLALALVIARGSAEPRGSLGEQTDPQVVKSLLPAGRADFPPKLSEEIKERASRIKAESAQRLGPMRDALFPAPEETLRSLFDERSRRWIPIRRVQRDAGSGQVRIHRIIESGIR